MPRADSDYQARSTRDRRKLRIVDAALWGVVDRTAAAAAETSVTVVPAPGTPLAGASPTRRSSAPAFRRMPGLLSPLSA